MNFHVYYVTWWIQRGFGPERYSGPHVWFVVPIDRANATDDAVSNVMLNPQSPYRRAALNQFFYTVETIEVPALPPPRKPNRLDPTLEVLP